MKRLFLLLVLACAAFGQMPKITNYGEVVRGVIYRGAQPDGSGLLDLAAGGFKSVLDLRGGKTVAREKIVASDLGLQFFSVPLNGLTAPTEAQVRQILFVLTVAPKPLFLHCQHGEDRTGTVVAIWRMEHGVSNTVALQEAKFYHINPLQFGMKHFIITYKPTVVQPTAAK
jgi:protein tyrosine phosphatase (PTP) superfamily phosphohydrolase (DUF442 family)